MARYSRSLGFVGLVLFLTVVPLLGHHSASSVYNPETKVTLKGTVTKILWANPHIAIYFDATDPKTGKVANWELGDGQAPNGLYRKGWRREDLKVGDVITVTNANVAWDGTNHIGGGVITNAAGERVFTGTKGDGL